MVNFPPPIYLKQVNPCFKCENNQAEYSFSVLFTIITEIAEDVAGEIPLELENASTEIGWVN